MIIRKATDSDVKAIKSCVDEAFGKYIPLIGRKPMPMQMDYAEIVKNDYVYAAVEDDTLIGALVVNDHGEPGSMFLDVVAVLDKYQGQGVGKALIAYAEKLIKNLGVNTITLYTNVKYEKNVAMYNHLGYKEYKRAAKDGYDLVFFMKEL